MKKTVLSLVCVSAVYLAISFGLRQPGTPAHQAAAQPTTATQESKAAPVRNEKPKLSVEERMRRDLEKLDEGLAKTRQSSTPEIRAAIRNRTVEKGREDYGKFFSTLELDASSASQAVDVIIERDLKILDANELLYETGFTKGGKQFGETMKIEKALAESQLQSLLGAKGYEKLVTFEKNRQAQSMAQAQKVISRLND